jgi:hypothetical protein
MMGIVSGGWGRLMLIVLEGGSMIMLDGGLGGTLMMGSVRWMGIRAGSVRDDWKFESRKGVKLALAVFSP